MREELITQRNVEYFSRDGLRTLTGLDEVKWSHAIIKELLDNSLDALDKAFSDKVIKQKKITVSIDDRRLVVADNAGGIPEDVLDDVFNFDVYTSSKRDYRTPTRGAQGNALKTVIGICYLSGYDLFFVTDGKCIRYLVNASKLRASILEFRKVVEDTSQGNCLMIDGIDTEDDLTSEYVWKLMRSYYLCNPDVRFELDGGWMEPVQEPQHKTERTYIHWYGGRDFEELLQKVHTKDPNRTVKDFSKTFSGTQRVLSKLDFPYKKLSEFVDKEEAIADLYEQLKELTKEPSSQILKRSLIGKETFLAIYGNPEDYKYKRVFGTYTVSGGKGRYFTIPFAIEGFLLTTANQYKPASVVSAVNNSVPYESVPFHFVWSVEFLVRKFHRNYASGSVSLDSILAERGFMEAEGVELYLHVVSPYFQFRDKAKTQINADDFKDELVKTVEYLCRDTIKEVDRARRVRKRFERERAFRKVKTESKNSLMEKYFWQGLEIAKGDYSTVTPRQMFYVIREIVIKGHDIELKKSDFNTFTQKVITAKFREHPELEDKIFFEPRGFFNDPFYNEELPLGTRNVIGFISRKREDRIYTEIGTIYSLPVEMLYPHVLFIEKAGFNTVFDESGLIDDLNMGIISTQGFSNRASKKLMKYLIDHGIVVYVLHDCDIFGYFIADKLLRGSNTFPDPLKVTDIGLNVSDLQALGKTPEVVSEKQSYSKSLHILSPEEYEFFLVDEYSNRYQRVELNALTNDELVEFVRQRMKRKTIDVTAEKLERYVEFDEEAIVKDALFKALPLDKMYKLLELAEVDKDELLKRVLDSVNGKEHWTATLKKEANAVRREKIRELEETVILSVEGVG